MASLSSETASPWTKFRVLCKYYAECVEASEKTQEFLYQNREHDLFSPLTLPSSWLRSALEGRSFEIELHRKRDMLFIAQLASVNTIEETVYMGYPLSLFKSKNNTVVASPILIIPVKVELTVNGRYSLELNLAETKLNNAWVDFNIPKEEQPRLLRRIIRQQDDDTGHSGLFNIELLCAYLEKYKASTPFDPKDVNGRIDWTLPPNSRTAVQNVAVLATGLKLKYAKNLRRELLAIRETSDETLDKTALAYIFREPPLPNVSREEGTRYPISFIPSNFEQAQALLDALNTPLSKVQGPPGTGKSQLAINLLANLVYHGESVLFTSKNHKAIHAVEEKISGILEDSKGDGINFSHANLDAGLVRFCSDPAGNQIFTWKKDDLKSFYQELAFLAHKEAKIKAETSSEDLDDALDEFSVLWPDLEKRRTLGEDLAVCEEEIADRSDSLKIPETVDVDGLQKEIIFLKKKAPEGWLGRLLWKWRKIALRQAETEQRLRRLFSGIHAQTLGHFLERLEKNLDRVTKLQASRQVLHKINAEVATLSSYEELLTEAKKCQARIRQKQVFAFLSALWHRMSKASQTEEPTRANLISQVEELEMASFGPIVSSTGASLHDSIREDFAKVVTAFNPAWAVTLLSLHRASPCAAAVFDHVIIDEAAQCEVPPIIPALFRARHATIVGDPKQFPPVVDLKKEAHHLILKRNGLLNPSNVSMQVRKTYTEYSFVNATAYSVAIVKMEHMLKEHFRCVAEIAQWFNDGYYGGQLKMRSPNSEHNEQFLKRINRRSAIEWEDVPNNTQGEITKAREIIFNLATIPFKGKRPTVGVISPSRELANQLRTALNGICSADMLNIAEDVNTVNSFQGGERDIIIIVLGINQRHIGIIGMLRQKSMRISTTWHSREQNFAASLSAIETSSRTRMTALS